MTRQELDAKLSDLLDQLREQEPSAYDQILLMPFAIDADWRTDEEIERFIEMIEDTLAGIE